MAEMEFRKILVPVDFSACSRRALDVALELAPKLGAELDVLHAWTAPAYVSPYVAVQLSAEGPPQTLESLARDEAQKEMDKFLIGIAPHAQTKLTVRIEFGFEAEAILAAALDYDLIVIGTHGRTGLAHLVMGSVAERVVRRSPVPVLTVRLAG